MDGWISGIEELAERAGHLTALNSVKMRPRIECMLR